MTIPIRRPFSDCLVKAHFLKRLILFPKQVFKTLEILCFKVSKSRFGISHHLKQNLLPQNVTQ